MVVVENGWILGDGLGVELGLVETRVIYDKIGVA